MQYQDDLKTALELQARGQAIAAWQHSLLCPRGFKLGVFSIVKVPEQVGAAKSARRKVGNRVPRKGFLFQESPSEQPNPHGARLGTGFPGRGSQARFPGRGSQARFPGTGSQVRFSRGSQEQVPKQGFPARGSQAEFPGRGKVFRKRFPVPRNRFPSKGSQARVPSKRFPSKVLRKRFPSKGSQEEVSRNKFPSKVPRNRFCKHGLQ